MLECLSTRCCAHVTWRRIHACHMRRRIHHTCMSNEEEDTCVSYVCALVAARMSYENMCPESVPVCVCVCVCCVCSCNIRIHVHMGRHCAHSQPLIHIYVYFTHARAHTHTHTYIGRHLRAFSAIKRPASLPSPLTMAAKRLTKFRRSTGDSSEVIPASSKLNLIKYIIRLCVCVCV
jgi:hypothetical protein